MIGVDLVTRYDFLIVCADDPVDWIDMQLFINQYYYLKSNNMTFVLSLYKFLDMDVQSWTSLELRSILI